jgi:hypothetical protein
MCVCVYVYVADSIACFFFFPLSSFLLHFSPRVGVCVSSGSCSRFCSRACKRAS